VAPRAFRAVHIDDNHKKYGGVSSFSSEVHITNITMKFSTAVAAAFFLTSASAFQPMAFVPRNFGKVSRSSALSMT
jgi:hypothetical protein